jgi:hypothetical protein
VIDEGSAGSDKPSGFAIRFTEFHGDSEIFLRTFLAKGDLRGFVEEFARKSLGGVSPDDYPKLVELVVRWEIHQEELRG